MPRSLTRDAPDGGRLSPSVLFIDGDFDQVCSITGNRREDPVRAACPDLTETSMPAGHRLPLEYEEEQIGTVRDWLRSEVLR